MLNNKRNSWAEKRLVLNLTYHPLLRDFQKVLNKAQILLTPNEEHETVFGKKPPMIGWRKVRTLKDYLVRTKITNRDTRESKSAPRNGNKYHICKGVINCNTDFTVDKFHCSCFSKHYDGSNVNDFRHQFNNYKSAFRKVSKSGKPPKS